MRCDTDGRMIVKASPKDPIAVFCRLWAWKQNLEVDMKTRVAVALASTLVCMALALTMPPVEAASTPSCSVTFLARTMNQGITTAIRSDGRGVYKDGLDGVSCQMGSAGGGTNIKLTLAAKKTTRQIQGNFSNVAQAFVGQPPTASMPGNYMTIQQTANIAVGGWVVTNAHFWFQNYTLNWCGGVNEGDCSTLYPGYMAVLVTRTSKTNWVVTTDQSVAGIGDAAELYDKTLNLPVALYHMPMQISIDCPTCN